MATHLSTPLDPLIAYQLGWQDANGRNVNGVEGKALRPTIALSAAEAVGGLPEDALLGAVALELIHNFSLVHDDLIDGDAERRHRPSLWARFGAGPAVAAGDAMAALAYDILLGEPAYGLEAAREFSRATVEMIRGQAEDLYFQSRAEVTEMQCLAMVSQKTGALFSCAAALGAILGGGDEAQIQALRGYGRLTGIAFQAIDDLLGIWGEPRRTGKPRASDLREKKRTLPIVHALAAGDDRAAQLRHLLERNVLDEQGLARAISLLEESGSRDWTRRLAEDYVDRAIDPLADANLAPQPVDDLRRLALFVVDRDF